MKILIIEDEEILAKVLKEDLEGNGHTIQVASDGGAAMPLAQSFEPDLILLDLILPEKDGFEVLKELKSDRRLSNVPVIVLSNLGEDDKIKNALKLGAVDYFVKSQHPVNEVVEKINEHSIKSK